MRRGLVVFVLIVGGSVCACRPPDPLARSGVLDLRDDPGALDATMRLDGEWEFYWRAQIRSEPGAAATMAAARIVTVPNNWSRYRIDGEKLPVFGHASYRLRVLLAEGRDGMALRIPDAGTAYRLYVNGELIAERGRIAAGPTDYRPIITRSLTPAFRLERESEIVFEVANFAHYASGIRSSVELGQHTKLYEERWGKSWLVILISGALVFMALYHVLLFSLDRRELPALFFAGMCICIFVRLAMFSTEIGLILMPGLSFDFFLRSTLTATYLVLPLCVGFVAYLFPELFDPRVTRFAAGGGIAVTLFSTFTPLHIGFGNTVPIFGMLFLSMSVYGVYRFVQGIRQNTPDTGLFLFAFLWFIVFATNDWLYAMRVINTGFLTEYGFTVFVFAQAIAVSRRILTSRRLSETLAADLQKSNTRLLSLDRLKDEFLAVTSHELRTPLQGIIGIAGSIRDRDSVVGPEEMDRRLDLIISSGRRLADLVAEILDFSALRYGDIQLNRASLDLHAFARLQLSLIEYNLDGAQKISLRNEVPVDLSPVLADESRLTQIFQNLLGNALKYTMDGAITIQARESQNGRIEISVVDTGEGIEPEQLERIFLPFEQGQDGPASKGIGLGLSIARALVELHGGELRVDSRPGAGSRFSFSLERSRVAPRTRNSEPATTARPLAPLSAVRLPAPAAGPAARTTRDESPNLPFVLLVDDEPVNLAVMSAYLEGSTRVEALEDGTVALGKLLEGPDSLPDLLVLDLMMPLAGADILRDLRAKYSLTELPILIATAMTRTNALLDALAAGANDYLTKPFEKDDFLLRVSNLTTLSRSHRGSQIALKEAARHERERINADLHDHLGASLTDLKIMSDLAVRNPDLDSQFTERLREKVGRVIRILREDLLGLDDLDLLEEDFLEGLHLTLLRRYVEAGREFDMQIEGDLEPDIDPEYRQILFAVLKEVVTNDLKYGDGPAVLRWRGADGVNIEFESLSNYRLETHRTGRGTAGMIRRLSAIGGWIQIQIDSEARSLPRPIRIDIRVP